MDVEGKSIQELITMLSSLANEIEVKEKELKAPKAQLKYLNSYIANKMVEEKMGKMEFEGVTFSPVTDSSYSLDRDILGEDADWDNEMFHSWLKEIGEGDVIKVAETVHYATRKKVLDTLIAQGIELPNYIKIGGYTRLDYNKAKIKRKALGEE